MRGFESTTLGEKRTLNFKMQKFPQYVVLLLRFAAYHERVALKGIAFVKI